MIYYIGNQRNFIAKDIQMSTISEFLDYFKNIDEIGLDTETTGFDPHSNKILSIQFGTFKDQFVINLTDVPIKEILPIFNYNCTFLLQNAKFDLKFLFKHGIKVNTLYDTFLAELILNTGIDRNDLHCALDDLVWKYCNKKLDKTIRSQINKEGMTERVIRYGAEDVQFLSLIKTHQLFQINNWNLQSILDLENEVTKVFAKMEYDGISLNTKQWAEVAVITENESKRIEKELDDIVNTDSKLRKFQSKAIQLNLFGYTERVSNINWSSSQQKLNILKALGIEEDSTGSRILMRNKNNHAIVPKLLEYNKYKKLSDAFGNNFLSFVNPITNRVHMDIWPILSTGRIAVSNPNLNQIPSKGDLAKTIRSCFIPKPGYKIVGGDYSGMELRIIAEFSQDPVWITAFNEDKDLHSELAALTFGIDISKVKEPFPPKPDLKYRDVQKTVNFGLAYGMSSFKLSDTIQVPVEDAQSIIDRFFKAVPKVKSFLHGLGESGKQRGYIRTGPVYSRVRWFPKWQETQNMSNPDRFKILGEIERASMNAPIQGCNGNIIKQALINTQKEIEDNNWPVNILLSVYDEIQTECREDAADQWCKKLEEIMVTTAQLVIKTIPVVADCSVHDYWEK